MRMLLATLSTLLIVGLLVLGVLRRPAVGLPAFADPGSLAGAQTSNRVTAGVPYVLRDGYATLICVSSRSGHPLPPFIVPQRRQSGALGNKGQILAWLPFVARDPFSTQLCVSSRAGWLLPPFVAP